MLKALPKPPYHEAFYWNKVYQDSFKQGAIEWGAAPSQILHYQWVGADGNVRDGALEEHAVKGSDLLVVGCGNSTLSEVMARAGWDPTKIHSCDFSATSIEQAVTRARTSGDERLAALRYQVADCRRLHETFPSSSFDGAVDKGKSRVISLGTHGCASHAHQRLPFDCHSWLPCRIPARMPMRLPDVLVLQGCSMRSTAAQQPSTPYPRQEEVCSASSAPVCPSLYVPVAPLSPDPAPPLAIMRSHTNTASQARDTYPSIRGVFLA